MNLIKSFVNVCKASMYCQVSSHAQVCRASREKLSTPSTPTRGVWLFVRQVAAAGWPATSDNFFLQILLLIWSLPDEPK